MRQVTHTLVIEDLNLSHSSLWCKTHIFYLFWSKCFSIMKECFLVTASSIMSRKHTTVCCYNNSLSLKGWLLHIGIPSMTILAIVRVTVVPRRYFLTIRQHSLQNYKKCITDHIYYSACNSNDIVIIYPFKVW